VLWKIADALCRRLAPILSFTAEEAYRSLPGQAAESVFLTAFPSGDELRKGCAPGEGERLVRKYTTFRAQVRPSVQKALESVRTGEDWRKESDGRVVGGSLDAQITLRAGSSLMGLLKGLEAELPELLKVSQIRLEPAGEAPEGLSVVVSRASGHRCARCWCYTVSLGTDRAHPDLCPKCTGAVLTDFPNGLPASSPGVS
jgi:isoleucyl-tRNA synthetase